MIINAPQLIKCKDYCWHLVKQKTYTQYSYKIGKLHTLILKILSKKYGQDVLKMLEKDKMYKALDINVEFFIKLSLATYDK